MLYRAAAVGIVLFWLVMTGLLVRMEWFPGASDLLPVPVNHLFKLMFLHEQVSDLVLFHDQERIGDLHLEPRRLSPAGTGAGRNSLTAIGSMLLDLPGLELQHLTLHCVMNLDDGNTVERFELTGTLHDAKQNSSSLVVTIGGEPPRSHYHYQVRRGDDILAEQDGTPAAILDQPQLESIGMTPALLDALGRRQAAATKMTARRGVLHTKGENIETYDVTIRQGDSVEATVQISQLGQILAAKTFAGYSLLDESLSP